MDRRIVHIQDLLSQSPGRYWTVAQMAEIAQVSSSHFKRLFRNQTGVSPMAYLHSLRLALARKLLSDPCCYLQVKEIAYKVGMTNGSQFTREFKKLTGCSPTEFRKMQDEIEQSKPPTVQE